jgi:hypothetical protein
MTHILRFESGIYLCVYCFLVKRNKSGGEENDKVKNKNWKERDGSECFTALKPMEVSHKRAAA